MSLSARPLRARVRLGAILHNYRFAKQSAPGTRALAVVKADAYGHGAVPVARSLESEADGFAVATLEEALELRDSGIRGPILLLEGVFSPQEVPRAAVAGLDMVVHSPEQLDWVTRSRPIGPLKCWIKIDTGMHRVGFPPDAFRAAYARLAECPHLSGLVAMTHFARADEPDDPYTRMQLATFDRVLGETRIASSLANSAAILAWPESHREWTRPGIMLYGASPFVSRHPLAEGLRPAMTLESALIAVRDLKPGDTIGYGGRFVCERPTRVGVAAVGYADGYPRHARDGTPVAVKGQLTRLIGRVSMDMITLDLTDVPDARVGDPVELWGEKVPADAVAACSDTISYQLFTGLGRRVARVYTGA